MLTNTDESPALPRRRPVRIKKVRAAFACLLLAVAALICAKQLWTGHLGPLAVALLVLTGAWCCLPSLKILCVLMPAATFTVLCMDAFLFQHRLAVGMRTWSPIWNDTRVISALRSPSGRSTVYIVGSHWLDSAYWAYISDGGLFPKSGFIATRGDDEVYHRDLTSRWNGGVFTVTEQFLALRYSEDSGIVETFTDGGS